MLKRKGFTDDDLWMIRCKEDAVKAIQRMSGLQFDEYIKRDKDNDIRVRWIVSEAKGYLTRNIHYRNISHPTITKADIYIEKITKDGVNFFEQIISKKTGKAICGYRLKGMPDGWICQKLAGFGTSHPGYGRCNSHERYLDLKDKKQLWEGLLKLKKARTFENIVDMSSELETVNQEIDSDLQYLYFVRNIGLKMAQQAMEREGSYPSNNLLNFLKNITNTIVNTKKTKHFVESRGMVPATQIPQLIIQVLQTVIDGEDIGVKERIIRRAMSLQEDLLLPYLDDPQFVPEYDRSPIKNSLREARNVLKTGEDFLDAAPKKAEIKADGYFDEHQ